jgi:hypothetical protein
MRLQPRSVSENLEALIIRQQELAAKLARGGMKMKIKARAARSKLMTLLNQPDLSLNLLLANQMPTAAPCTTTTASWGADNFRDVVFNMEVSR